MRHSMNGAVEHEPFESEASTVPHCPTIQHAASCHSLDCTYIM